MMFELLLRGRCTNMATMSRRGYGGVSAAQRSRQRRERLLEETLAVVGSEGFNALSVSGLCRATGLNDRYFYEHFADRDAVFAGLIDQLADETMAAMVAAVSVAGADVDAVIGAGLRACIEYLTDDPRRARAVFVEAAAHDPSHRRRDVRDMFVTLMHAQAQLRFGDRTSSIAGEIRFAGIHLFGALMETTTSWLDDELAMTRDELIAHTASLFGTIVRGVLARSENAAAVPRTRQPIRRE